MEREQWIRDRAYQLWERHGRPGGEDVDFWLAAEREYNTGHLCILSHGHCPFQSEWPTTGGRHVEICTADIKYCKNRLDCGVK
jgi:hypothetical protein